MSLNTNRWNRIRYTLYSPIYDHLVRFKRQRRRSLSLLNLRPDERVLIVGAGTGADLPFFPEGVNITATDLTPAMVNRLRRRAARLGLNVDARPMDGQQLEFPDASFDAVVLHLIVAVIPDPVACLREAARVTRPGGRIAVFDKFQPPGTTPSLGRRVLNLLTNFLFSDITRAIEPLLEGLPLEIERDEPAFLGAQFRILLLRRTDE